ncbi:uncharacterized protein [Nicotiana sylvestris]|uniref:uncharacterized protein n=1 Tax=Nicotiana sylvestris TaxID=4096 RepID=UPI00388CCCDB
MSMEGVRLANFFAIVSLFTNLLLLSWFLQGFSYASVAPFWAYLYKSLIDDWKTFLAFGIFSGPYDMRFLIKPYYKEKVLIIKGRLQGVDQKRDGRLQAKPIQICFIIARLLKLHPEEEMQNK